MNKVQVLVDDDLYHRMVSNSKESGLSLSALTRVALLRLFKPKERLNALDQAIMDLQSGDVEEISVKELKSELTDLKNGRYKDKTVQKRH